MLVALDDGHVEVVLSFTVLPFRGPGAGSLLARVPVAPHLLLGKQIPGGYCTRGVYGALIAVKRQAERHKASLCFTAL